jgi:hypothetical protein
MPKAVSRVAIPCNAIGRARGDNQFLPLRQLIARNLHALERDHVFAAAQPKVVGHANRRQQIAEVGRELLADGGNASQADASFGLARLSHF